MACALCSKWSASAFLFFAISVLTAIPTRTFRFAPQEPMGRPGPFPGQRHLAAKALEQHPFSSGPKYVPCLPREWVPVISPRRISRKSSGGGAENSGGFCPRRNPIRFSRNRGATIIHHDQTRIFFRSAAGWRKPSSITRARFCSKGLGQGTLFSFLFWQDRARLPPSLGRKHRQAPFGFPFGGQGRRNNTRDGRPPGFRCGPGSHP